MACTAIGSGSWPASRGSCSGLGSGTAGKGESVGQTIKPMQAAAELRLGTGAAQSERLTAVPLHRPHAQLAARIQQLIPPLVISLHNLHNLL